MTTQRIRKTLIAAVAGIALSSPFAALASGPMEHISIRVSYADLDLTDARDQGRLEARIGRAARTICGPTSPRDVAGSLRQARENQACHAQVKADAIAASGLRLQGNRYARVD